MTFLLFCNTSSKLNFRYN